MRNKQETSTHGEFTMRAFISYCHRDEAVLNRLHVHLAALRREGQIEAWFDREILAGNVLGDQINRELEAAELYLLLVSPDFIASDYCVEREMRRALERHDAGEARVVPIVVEPCDWAAMPPLRRLKALPKDGLPISEWANANTAYLNIVQELRRIINATEAAPPAPAAAKIPVARAEAQRYRIKRDFDEIDRSEFRDAAFETIKNYFRRATAEINTIDGLKGRFVDRSAASFGCTVVNQGRQRGTAHITAHCKNGRSAFADISFSFSENAPDNSANGGLEVSSDEYEQFLVVVMQVFRDAPARLTPEQAAEYLWNQFIEQAGINHD